MIRRNLRGNFKNYDKREKICRAKVVNGQTLTNAVQFSDVKADVIFLPIPPLILFYTVKDCETIYTCFFSPKRKFFRLQQYFM